MLSPEYLQQQQDIINTKSKVDYAKHQNDLLEQEIKARELQQQHKNNLNTLNIIASTAEQIDPSTIGQVVSQINSEQKDISKELSKRALKMNEFNALMGQFNTHYI